MRKTFHLMAKPASFHCNLACDYCFYLPKGETLCTPPTPLRHMSEPVLRRFIQRYIAASPGNDVAFSWQGGEPTLSGLAFFRHVVALQTHYANGKRITNSLQTNGVLLDAAWARFFAEHAFLVGVSVDGPQHVYDAMRKTRSGRSVFHNVLRGIAHLRDAGVEYNLLAVVNAYSARYPLEIYRFLTREPGAAYVQFIPAVERNPVHQQAEQRVGEILYPAADAVMPWSVCAEDYGAFLTTVFDEWVRRDVGRVFVQIFDNTLAAWAGETPELCVMRPTCGSALVLEQNGDIYSCDHFVTPQHKLGNILTDAPDRLAGGKAQRRFGAAKTPASAQCQTCAYRFACQGGCPKHRIVPAGKHQQNYLCAGYYRYFQHVAPYMAWMAGELTRHRPPAGIMNVAPFIAARQ